MSGNQKLESNGMQDKEILHKFISQAEPLLSQSKSNELTLTKIYENAAKELETYYDDHSMICARLSRVFPKDQSRLIRKSLNPKYKRGYGAETTLADLPITEVEELFMELKSALESLTKINERIISKITIPVHIKIKMNDGKELTGDEKKAIALIVKYQNIIFSAFGTSTELKKSIMMVRKLNEDANEIADQFDNRLKLDDYKRTLIKSLDNMILLYKPIGKKWHMCAKWIKQVVEDPVLDKIIAQSENCPNCDYNMADSYNKNAQRVREGLTPKLPKAYLDPQNYVYPQSKAKKIQ